MSSAPPDSKWRLRPAQIEDAPGIAKVHVLSWQHAYRGLLPDTLLDSLSIERRSEQWRSWIQAAAPKSIWVGQAGQALAGFVIGGAERSGTAGYTGEIQAIYLLPSYQGQGLGQALFGQMQRQLCDQGLHAQLVWVLKDNLSACRFYARQGGEPRLAREVQIGDPAVTVAETGYTWHF